MRWILVMAVAACSPGRVTSLDGDIVISTMSKDEIAQFCKDFDRWARRSRVGLNRRLKCAMEALEPDSHDPKSDNLYEVQQHCRTVRHACEQKLDKLTEPPALDCADFMKDFDDCDRLTIGEFDSCTRESLEEEKVDLEQDWCLYDHKGFTTDDYIKFLDNFKSRGPACALQDDKCKKKPKP